VVKINGFIHVKKSKTPGVLFEYGISKTIREIKDGAKSRYYPVELSKVLKEIEDTPGNYAIVGIPEIITEVRLLAENNSVIRDRIKYFFGLVCGHQKTTKYAEAIAWEYGIKPGDLEDIDFRAKKKTGSAIEYDMKFTGKVRGKKKTFIVKNNEPFVSSWAHGFFKAKFSDFTDNTFNENADIVFGDAWLDDYNKDPMGNNILIVRDRELAKIIKHGINYSEIKVDKVSEETIMRSQQGLVHHTRDELPYRLYKEDKKYGWAPKKRVEPSNVLEKHRKKIQDARQNIAEKSHIYYKEAVSRGDFELFKKKMQPYINKYKRLYEQSLPSEAKHIVADGVILTLTGYHNYGNVIQRYALQEFLRQNGYKFVSYADPFSDPHGIYSISRKTKLKTPLRFVKRFLNYQKPYWYVPKYNELYPEARSWVNTIDFVNKNIWIKPFGPNDKYKNYIVGSDQVWRDWWGNREILGYYFLNFLKGRKANRIAYAASFGKDRAEDVMTKEEIEYVRPYIEEFNKISVREKTGVKILKETWGIEDVDEVVDPTLLLKASDYSKLIDNSKVKYDKIAPIFAYILKETPDLQKFIRKIQDNKKQAMTKIHASTGKENDKLPPVELWLKGFRDAELVVTNSFHGMLFSIINNTNFIIIGRKDGGLSRIKDLLSKYGIDNLFVDETKLDNFDFSKLENVDWKSVNEKLKETRVDSERWLLKYIE
jgi:coenzyme F420-reducing hydrogenase beta subunit